MGTAKEDLLKQYDSYIENTNIGNVEFDNKQDNKDVISEYTSLLEKKNKNKAIPLGFDSDKYSKYIGEVFDPTTNINERRAQAQTTGQLIKGFTGQLASEALIGMGEAVGYALDFEEIYNADQQSQEGFDNWFSEIMRNAKEHVQEEWFPLYMTEKAQNGTFWEQISEPTWWASQGKTFGTTLSLMAPSIAVGGIATAASGGLGAGAAAGMIGAMTSAMFSRKAESAMEANQAFQQEYQKYIQEGKSELDARKLAGESAATVFKANAAMLPVDFLQFATLTKAFAPIKGVLESSKAAKGLNFGFQMGSEAAEEAYQFIAQEEAIRQVRDGITPFGTGFNDRISEYVKDPQFQTSAFMGAVTGGLFEGLGGVTRKVQQGIENIGVNKAIAANLGDVDSFNKLDNKNQAQLITRALMSNKIDRLVSTANATLEDYKSKEGNTPESIAEVESKINKLIENATYVKQVDEELKTTNPEYASNPNIRRQVSLLKYEDKVNSEYIDNLTQKVRDVESKVDSDPRDQAFITSLKLKTLENKKERINNSDLNNTDKKKELNSIDAQINQVKETLNSQLEDVKNNPEHKGFKLSEYSSPVSKQYTTDLISLELAKTNKKMLRKTLAEYDTKTSAQIAKEEKNVVSERNKNVANTVVEGFDSAEAVNNIINNTESTDIGTDINNAVNEQAKTQEQPNYSKTPEVTTHDKINEDTGEVEGVEIKKWKLPTYENSPHLEAKDVNELKKLLKSLNNKDVNDVLDYKTTAKDLNETLETLYLSDLAQQVSDIVGKFLSDKEINKASNEETVTVFTSDTAIVDTPELPDVEKKEVELLATAPRYSIENGKIIVGEERTPIDDPDFDYSFNDNPKSLPQDFEVSFEINFEGAYNKGAIKWDKNTITNPDDVQILTVYYDSKGKRHVLAVLTNTKGLTNKITPDVKERLDNLRKVIIEEAIKNKKSGEITKTNITASSKRTPGLFNTSETLSPVTDIKPNQLAPEGLLIGIVRYNKESGININTPNNEQYDEPFVDRQAGSVVVWVKGVNGEIVPARAFTKSFNQIKNDKKSLYNRELQEIRDILSNINKDNVEEQLKALQGYFFAPYMIKKDKQGNIISITFTKNKIAMSIQNLRVAQALDKKNGTNNFRALKYNLEKTLKIESGELDNIIRGDTILFNNRYARYNYTINIGNTRNKTTDLNSAYSVGFEEFLGDLVHQVDVNKVNTVTVKSGRKYKYNTALKDYVYVNFNVEQVTTSPKFYLKDFKYPEQEVTETKEEIKSSQSANLTSVLGVASTERVEDLTTESGVEIDTSEAPLQNQEGVIENETVVSKERIEESRNEPNLNLRKGKKKKRKVELPSNKKTKFKEWNKDKEISWLKKNLPLGDTVNLEVVDTLIEIGNEQSWGTFQYNLITIYNKALQGTAYHEGFHAVFNMALNTNDRVAVLEEAKKKYGNLSDIALEERLAEEFTEYVLSLEYSGKSLTEKIRTFFRKIYNFIKYNLFRNNIINELFYNINTGKYQGETFVAQSDVLLSRVKDSYGRGLNYVEEKQASTDIASMMSDILDEEMADIENKGQSRINVIKDLAQDGFSGIEILLADAFDRFSDNWKNHPSFRSNDYVDELFGIIRNNILSVETTEEGSRIILGRVGKNALKRFSQTELLNITLNSGDNFTTKEITPDINDIEEQENELNRKEHWMIQATELSLKSKVGSDIRSTLSRINKVDKDGKPIYDNLGFKQYLDYNQAFATLIKELSGNSEASDMLLALEEFIQFSPEYGALLTRLQNDEQLKTKFYNALQNVHMDYRILNEEIDRKTKKKRFIWLSANRQNVTQSILNEWRENINNSSVNKALTLTQEERDKELGKFKKAIATLRGKSLTKEEKQQKNEAFSNYLNEYGIEVSKDELDSLMEIDSKKRGSTGTLYDRFLTLMVESMNNIIQGFDPVSKNLNDIKEAARLVGRLRPEYMESNFRDLKNKTNYSHIQMGFITKLFANLKKTVKGEWNRNTLEGLLSYKGYEYIPWLTSLENKEFRDNFNLSIFKGLSPKKSSVGIDYDGMSESQLLASRLNMFFNNGKVGYATYMLPTLAGSGTSMTVQAPVHTLNEDITKDGAIDDVYSMLKLEHTFIKNSDSVKNVEVLKNKASKFVIFEELFNLLKIPQESYKNKFENINKYEELDNLVEADKIINSIKKDIKKYLDIKYEKNLKKIKDLGIIKEDKDEGLFTEVLDSRITEEVAEELVDKAKRYSNLEAFIKSYVYNTVAARGQMLVLFTGTTAAYKNSEDLYKRMKEIWTPGSIIDTEAIINLNEEQAALEGSSTIKVRKNYTAVVLDDIQEYSSTKHGEEVLKVHLARVKKGELTNDEAYRLAAKQGYTNAQDSEGNPVARVTLEDGTTYDIPTGTNEVTDGYSIVRPKRYREVIIGLGKATKSFIDEFFKFEKGLPSSIVNTPYKPFAFGHKDVNGFRVPYQIKNSEAVADPSVYFYTKKGDIKLPTEADRLNNYESYVSPTLAKLLDYMDRHSYDDNKYVDTIHFKSTFKVGAERVGTLDNLDSAEVQIISNSDLLIVSETPDHITDESGMFGTQIRRLSVSDIGDDAQFLLPGLSGLQSKQFILDAYQDIIETDVKKDFTRVERIFPTQEDSLEDYNDKMLDLSEELQKGLLKLNADEDSIHAVGTYINKDDGKRYFNVPLFDPLHGNLTESLLGSMFRNGVVKQKIKGGNAVMVSSIGLSDELEINWEDGAIESIDCMLPWWSEEALENVIDKKTGIVDVNKIKDKRILDLIGYRIPTEDKYSILPLRVKRFLPRSAGAIIILPREITTLTGADFDIDKMYLMLTSYSTYTNDQAKKINSIIQKEHRKALKEGKTKLHMGVNTEYDIIRVLDWAEREGVSNLSTLDKLIYQYYQYGLKNNLFEVPQEYRKIEYDFAKPANEQSRAARDNGKIDVMRSVLTNKDTASKQTDPGNFDYFEGIVNEIKQLTGYKADLDILDPDTDIEMFKAAQAASELIGVFATENATHATFQSGNVALTDPIIFGRDKKGNPVKYDNLSQIDIKEDISDEFFEGEPRRISRGLSMYLSAIVDDLKHLNSGPANINFFTVNALTIMRRLGFSMKTGLAFINQPIIKELMDVYYDLGGTIDKYPKALGIVQSKYKGSTLSTADLNGKLLFSYIGKQDSDFTGNALETFQQNQYDILDMFDQLRSLSWDLSKTTQVLKADNTNRKITIADSYKFKLAFDKVMKLKSIKGFKELWQNARVPRAFYEYTVDKADALMNQFYTFNHDGFDAMKKAIVSNLVGTKELNTKQIKFINYQLLGIATSQFEFFDGTLTRPDGISNKEYYLKKFPDEFNKLVTKYPELKENYRFIRLLRVTKADNYTPVDRIAIRSVSNLKPADRTEVKQDWLSLLWYRNAENPAKEKEIRQMAEDLVKYNYHAYGFNVGRGSFTEFVPMQWREGLQDSNGKHYSTFLEEFFEKSKDSLIFANIYQQFFQHNYKNRYYVPRYEGLNEETKDKLIKRDRFITGDNNEPLMLTIDARNNNDIMVNDAKMVDYITVDYNDNIYLMKLNKDTLIKNDFNGNVITGTYELLNVLGYPNLAQEYNINTYDVKSVFEFNNDHRPKLSYKNARTNIMDAAEYINTLREPKEYVPSEIDIDKEIEKLEGGYIPLSEEAIQAELSKFEAKQEEKASAKSSPLGTQTSEAFDNLMKELGKSEDDINEEGEDINKKCNK